MNRVQDITTVPYNNDNGLPRGLVFIFLTQNLEILSQYSSKFLLNQFLKTVYGLEAYQAKVVVHLVNGFNSMGSIVGASLADSYWGAYRTITYAFIPYILGTGLLSLFSINNLLAKYGELPLWSFIMPCLLIAMGLGGYNPCIYSMGGNQFLGHQKTWVDRYFNLNFVAAISLMIPMMYVMPTLKNKITCFGRECYPLTYGICVVILLLAYTFFLLGKSRYRIVPPQGIFFPWRILQLSTRNSHTSLNESDKLFLKEIQQFKRVCLFSVVIGFHFLLDEQCGTEWMNQYEYMDKHILGIPLPTEACTILTYVSIVIVTPLLSLVIYPYFEKRHVAISPVKRILVGYFFIILAFTTSTVLEYYVQLNATNAVIHQGVVIDCPNCLNGSWQIPQYLLASVSNAIILPSMSLFLYQNVAPQLRSTSSSLLFFSIFLGNLMILILEFPFHYLPTATSRQWTYISISIGGLLLSILLVRRWFKVPYYYNENPPTEIIS